MIAAAKSNLKAVSLELGGKLPLIVFEGVDMDKTAAAAVGSISTGELQRLLPTTTATKMFAFRLRPDLHGILASVYPEECSGRL
jgi:hypothetical protein